MAPRGNLRAPYTIRYAFRRPHTAPRPFFFFFFFLKIYKAMSDGRSSSTSTSLQMPRGRRLDPCYNEAADGRDGRADFRRARRASVYVYDNNSTDDTGGGRRAPAQSSGRSRCRARATSCAGCSPTSRPTSTCWSTGTTPTMRPRRPDRQLLDEGRSTWWTARRSQIAKPPTGRGTGSATSC